MNISDQMFGKMVRVKMTDGAEFVGILDNYTSAMDNEPDPASITIESTSGGLIELFLTEIVDIVLN